MPRFLTLSVMLLFSTALWAQKHILVLQSYDMSYKWAETLHQGISQGLEPLPNEYDVEYEFMDTRRYKSKNYFAKLANWYEQKYQGVSFDIVITTDDDAFNFFMEYYPRLFPKSALFFGGKGTFDETLLSTHPNPIRGVIEEIDMLDTLRLAGEIHQTKKAYFIVDASTTGNIQHNIWMKAFTEKAPDFVVESLHLVNYSHDEILEKVKTLKEGIILMNVVGQDRLGHVEDNLVMTKKIADVSPLPIYVESSMRVGFGTVGGRVVDGVSHGKLIAQKVVNFINGKDAKPYIDHENGNLLIFDYPALEKFKIDPEILPKGSIVLHRPLSLYEHYRTAFWSLGFLVIILISVITAQSLRIHGRRIFETKLKELVNQRTGELNLQIEEQKRLRKTLISREKLASLGNLTAGIAHEIKNPLNIIINSAQVIESRAKTLPDQDSKALVDINRMTQLIVRNSFRADSIIQNMLGQVSNAEAPISLVDVNQLIDEAFALVYHASKAKYEINVGIKKDFGNIPEITLSKENILRAMINILENSFYALSEKSKITPDHKPLIEIKTFLEKKMLLIELKDNGIGIPSAVVEKILHPFFTTKPAGVGTGLGLSMVNDIVSSHEGELEILTEEGEFTLIKIYLPLK